MAALILQFSYSTFFHSRNPPLALAAPPNPLIHSRLTSSNASSNRAAVAALLLGRIHLCCRPAYSSNSIKSRRVPSSSSASSHSSDWCARSPRISRPISDSRAPPLPLFRKPPNCTSSDFLRIPTFAPSMPRGSP
ncbi:hypothetical protein KSP40_PGU014427 [Platanthera guangdongensis]|uniref:Uncharacterized protein n=1 Tax=Platanthera guangdongensis TaxID=2320717 RepID=A0ABR2LDG2_9ASPA